MGAVQIGVRSAVQSWTGKANAPLNEDWDSYAYRMQRYQDALHFYSNTIYTSINSNAQKLKIDEKLYRHIRGIYNPVYRLAEGVVTSVYGGRVDMHELRTGALPLEMDDDVLREAIIQIYRWSKMAFVLPVYARNAALYGDGFLMVVDDVGKEQVRIEPLDPRYILDMTTDAVGNIKEIIIQYERKDEAGTDYIFTQTITKDEFATYKDGELFAYTQELGDTAQAQYPNPYGFVPVVKAPYKTLGYKFGVNAFNAQVGKINALNDMASLLGDNLRNAVNVLFFAKGIMKNGLTTNQDEPNRDDVRVVYSSNKDADLVPLMAQIDWAGVGQTIGGMLIELEQDLPILGLDRIRKGANLTEPGVRSASADMVKQVESVESSLDDGLVRASQMAVSIGAYRGYTAFTAFTLDSYERGDLDFVIETRDIFHTELTRQEKIQTLMGLGDHPLQSLIMEEMGYSPDAIQDAERRVTRIQQAKINQSMLERLQMQANQMNQAGAQNGQSQNQSNLPTESGASAGADG